MYTEVKNSKNNNKAVVHLFDPETSHNEVKEFYF